ncbi:hypothetical protein [Bacillus altitudinis]|nr:hypothetical protein [Bacillus altitudinis]
MRRNSLGRDGWPTSYFISDFTATVKPKMISVAMAAQSIGCHLA